MLIRRSVLRVAVGLLVVTTLGLSGCASNGQPAAGPTNPPGGYDISRIDQLANQFPPGYSVTPIPPTTLTQEQADEFGDMIKKFGFTVDPPQCSAALKSLQLVGGTKLQGLSAKGPQDIAVVAAQAPQPIPSPPTGDSCSHIAFTSNVGHGTADRVPGPAISGVTTVGVKMHIDITVSGSSTTMDQQMYIAALGDRTAVTVTGQSVTGQSDAQPLEALLVKAVTAVRGH
jgi:Domain of unknown function (DUF5642)